ncbi:MAG: spore coat protein CotJB, partial [Clostridia bacterium]|nr:spore coat protein CotJB [Clostridia bacterium]
MVITGKRSTENMNDQKKLKKMIENCAFVVYETALYLDTHPDCRAAL